MGKARVIMVALTLPGLPGCAPEITPEIEAQMQASVLDAIEDGVTTRADVLLRYGTPIADYEGERILAYSMEANDDNTLHPVGTHSEHGYVTWPERTYHLILVFDERGVLVRHSLVRVR